MRDIPPDLLTRVKRRISGPTRLALSKVGLNAGGVYRGRAGYTHRAVPRLTEHGDRPTGGGGVTSPFTPPPVESKQKQPSKRKAAPKAGAAKRTPAKTGSPAKRKSGK